MNDENKHLRNVIAKMQRIANNAIYFGDNSDYRTALYEICAESGMEEDTIGEEFKDETTEGNK